MLPAVTLLWSQPANAVELGMELIASSDESVMNKQSGT